MKNSIAYEQMEVDGREFLLVGVRNSIGGMGMCRISNEFASSRKECFFLGQEALIDFLTPNPENHHASKIIWQNSDRAKCGDNMINRLCTATTNYFGYGYDISRAIEPIFDLLSNGLYCIHEAKMFPTDGSGNFFWNGYMIKQEYNGSADVNNALEGKNFVPCFLIPTEQISTFSRSKLQIETEKIKTKKKIGGLAYHTSGMFSALLAGHHAALAALLNDVDFRCLVIEPITKVISEELSDTYESQSGFFEKKHSVITAVGCPFVSIPIAAMPKNMLETFLITRKNAKPKYFDDIKHSADLPVKIRNKKLIPADTYSKAELCPDCEMIESAYVIDSLSTAQAEALLAGQLEIDGEIIVSSNYYNSIVTACNFLQYTDYDRFIEFTARILMNPTLAAVHGYIANRVARIMNYKLFDAFKMVLSSSDEAYRQIMPVAAKYVDAYTQHMERIRQDEIAEQTRVQTKKAEILKEQEAKALSSLEMAQQITSMSKKK